MGAINFSIDSKLIETLHNHLPLDVFIETGTFKGDTIDVIKNYFNHIYSIELSEYYYNQVINKFGSDPKISFIHGDSATALQEIVPKVQDRSIVFWLDAHWCVANSTAGELSQCPLLAELCAIKKLNTKSIIIIDDARLFLATPQEPHEVSNWPSLHEVIQTLFSLSNEHQLSIVNDCILFSPTSIEEPIKNYARIHGVDWLDILNRCRDTEAMLLKVNQYIDMLQNIGFWRRVRQLAGYSLRRMGIL